MERKETIIIRTHSVIDVITNSSTEMFVIDKTQRVSVDLINAAIKEKFPDSNLQACLQTPDWYYYQDEEDVKEIISRLEARGYQIIAPADELEPQEIHISCERGGMSSEFRKFIEEMFNGEYKTY